MSSRAISVMMMALVMGLGAAVHAQDAETDAETEQPDAEPKPETREAPPNKLPVEDPTIHRERHEELQGGTKADEAQETKATQETKETGEAEAESDTEAAAGPPEQTTSALPIEDPTLNTEERVELTSEPTPEDEEPGEKPSEAPEEDDWGQNVKVAYGYQGGLLVAVDDWFYIVLSGLVQARYSVNYRTKPPTDPTTGIRQKQVTQGFDVARARFQLGIGLTQFVALYMRIGVVSGGDFSFQRAFIDLKWKYLRLRAGLFINELIAESLINPNDLLFNDYSILDNVFSPGSSKGVMLTYLRKRFSINLGYSDGLRTGFAEVGSAQRADFAVTLRTQYAWGDRGLSGFNRLVARRGTPLGIRLGGAMHYQDGGRSQGTSDVQIGFGTIDLSVRGSGWSLLAAGTAGQDAPSSSIPAAQSFEVVTGALSVMGGYFVLKDLQVFGQYGFVAKPRLQGEPPPTMPGAPTPEPSSLHAFGVGLSYFVVPGYDNVKLSTDFQYFLGNQLQSSVPSSNVNDIRPASDGSQFFWRIQLSAAF